MSGGALGGGGDGGGGEGGGGDGGGGDGEGGGGDGGGGDGGGWHQHDVSLKYTAHDESVPSFNSSVHELDSWHKVVLAWYSYAMQLQYKSHRSSH